MKIAGACLALLLLAPLAAAASPEEEAAADNLARLIHGAIMMRLPPVFEDRSGWGQTVLPPPRMRLPRLRRAVVEVDGHLEVPDGPWRKLRVRVENPDRDLRVRVVDFRRLEAMTYRVAVQIDVAAQAEADVQAWRNGLLLADLTAHADVGLAAIVECDVAARLETGRLPPRVVLEPTVREVKLNLSEFTPRQVDFHRAGVMVDIDREAAAELQLKDLLQERLRSFEPMAKVRIEEALRRALRAGADPSRAGAVLKAIGPLLRAK